MDSPQLDQPGRLGPRQGAGGAGQARQRPDAAQRAAGNPRRNLPTDLLGAAEDLLDVVPLAEQLA